MCIETQSLATALLPQFASEIGYDVQLMRLLSGYQLNPGTETYNAVKNYLVKQRSKQQNTLNTFNTGKRLDLNILDYENNLLWSTASLAKQDKIVLTYQASEYSQQATEGSAYQKFEDGSEYNLAWVSGGPLFTGGGAFKIGTNLNSSDTEYTSYGLSLSVTGNVASGAYSDGSNNNYTYYVFTGDGTFEISNYSYLDDQYVPINYFLVGGGGKGGNNNGGTEAGGGGGGGEVLTGYIEYINDSSYITVTVGDGGSNSLLDYPVEGTITANTGSAGDNGGYGDGGDYGGGGSAGGKGADYGAGGGGGAGQAGTSGSNTLCYIGVGGNGIVVPTQTGIPTSISGYYTSSDLFSAGGGGGANGESCSDRTLGGNANDDLPGGGYGNGSESSYDGQDGQFYGSGGGGAGIEGGSGGGAGSEGFCVLSILTSFISSES